MGLSDALALDMGEGRVERSSSAFLAQLFALGVGLLLFGDYLTLSVSRLLTDTTGNWILYSGVLQIALVALALPNGLLRGALLRPETLCFAGLGLIWIVHAARAEVDSSALGEYGAQKMVGHFAVSAPALLCGLALGRVSDALRARWLLAFLAPLLVMCALSLASDPSRLTIAYYGQMHVYFGLLVLPAHQGLAFMLAKCSVGLYGLAQERHRGPWFRRLALLLVGALVGLALLSGSRGYLLATVAALGVLWTLSRGRLGFVLTATAVAYALFQFMPVEIVDRFDPAQIFESAAYNERREAWGIAWDAFLAAPLLGHGPGGFADIHFWSYRAYPHNIFLEIACEFGILGLALFGAIVWLACRRIWLLHRHDAPPTSVQLFAVGFFVFALLGAMSVGDLIRNHFLWLSLGALLASTDRLSRGPGTPSRSGHRRSRAATAVWHPHP